jgi:hypothetical protein
MISSIVDSVTTTIPGFVSSGGSVSVGSSGPVPQTTPLTITNSTSGFGFAPLTGILFDVVAIFFALFFVGILVIVVVANRADPDPTGRRPQSIYYFAVSFVTLLTSIIGSAVVVTGLVQYIGRHSGSITNVVARTVVIGGLITLVSFILLLTHLRRGLVLARAGGALTSPSRRVGQSYVSAMAFLSVLVLLVATIFSIYLIFGIAGPGVFGSFGGRSSAVRFLVVALYLGAVAVAVLGTHRNLLSPGLKFFGRSDGSADTAEPPPEPAGPAVHPTA